MLYTVRPASDVVANWGKESASGEGHYQMVGASVPDGDNALRATSEVDDSFTVDDSGSTLQLPAGSAIRSVKVVARAWDFAGEGGQLKLLVSENDQTSESAAKSLSPDDYAEVSQTWTTRPSDSQAWTVADVEGMEIGLRAPFGTVDVRVTHVYAVVDFHPPPRNTVEE